MDDNRKEQLLEETKNIIKEKEDKILKSQVRLNVLQASKKKLEKQKKSIKKGWKSHISAVVFYILYNLVMGFLLGVYILPFIDIFKIATAIQKTIYIIALYVGVLSISILGAYIAAKVEMLLKNKTKSKCLKISNQIELKEQQIIQEKELQELLKKEITITLNSLDSDKNEILLPERNLIYTNTQEDGKEDIHLDNTSIMPYIRRKKRY